MMRYGDPRKGIFRVHGDCQRDRSVPCSAEERSFRKGYVMRQFAAVLCLVCASLIALPAPAAAVDMVGTGLNVAESLSMPPDLVGPTYLELVRTVRPKKLYDHTRDPSSPPYGEHGLWRVQMPINIDVLAIVLPWCGSAYFLGFDHFAIPDVARGNIDPRPYQRALGIR